MALFVAPLYHQTETTGIMKTIQTINGFKTVLGQKKQKKHTVIIAVNQESFAKIRHY
jgi:hypothetical protein